MDNRLKIIFNEKDKEKKEKKMKKKFNSIFLFCVFTYNKY